MPLNKHLNGNSVLIIDIGGTNTRICLIDDENFINRSEYSSICVHKEKVQCKQDFLLFIKIILSEHYGGTKIEQCVISAAGPILNERAVRITNWIDNSILTTQEISEYGIPENRINIINDMEAAGYGVLLLADRGHIPPNYIETIYQPRSSLSNKENDKVLIAPGTGLGTLGIVSYRNSGRKNSYRLLPSEVGHVPASIISDEHELVRKWISRKEGRYLLSWEDYVSGRGLENIYQAFKDAKQNSSQIPQRTSNFDSTISAKIIADNALRKIDNISTSALELYYQCAGIAAQTMALAFQPFGGIFLGGDNSRYNADFIKNGIFLKSLQQNSKQGELLKYFPVYLITAENLNILGSIWASRILR